MRFQVLTAASMMFRVVFWDILPCKMIVDRRFRGAYCIPHQGWKKTTLNIKFYVILNSERGSCFIVKGKMHFLVKK
jgi:hypothetical protein